MINIKIPKNKNDKFIEKFFIQKNLKIIVDLSKKNKPSVNEMVLSEAYMPDLKDLYRLYQYVLLNKRTTIFEFGSGWSTLIFNLALSELKVKFSKKINNLRRNNPFEIFVLETSKKFMKISKSRVNHFNKLLEIKNPAKIHYTQSDVEMTLLNQNICTQYKKIPLCNPDFIYLDGPDQFDVKNDIKGISTRHKDMMPMVSDILNLEYFYTPGTIIICDGRGANARFLKDNFKRKWEYICDNKNDQHIFWLNDPILGKHNKAQLEFYDK